MAQPDVRNEELAALEVQETEEWLESLESVMQREGQKRVVDLLHQLQVKATEFGIKTPFSSNTPYLNTIPRIEQPSYPGDREIERRVKSMIRWNAMAMVVHANREEHGIGGHISTYASAATLYEVAFNHFFRAGTEIESGDQIYFQGHASPGIYARAFLEGRISEQDLSRFRRELAREGGLSSYPHPWLMPGFWQFPTVSMGLGPLMAIYQARFNRYLEDRGLVAKKTGRVWAFLGDGEIDEPETLGAIAHASREGLDNLIFVMNCNLQRLDGPVRGNGKIIQEAEAVFRGAGWNVIKVIWGSDWDPLLEQDEDGILVKRMEEAVDGDYQKYVVAGGAYIREHFFGTDPRLERLASHLSDDELSRLRRGGHDPVKVFAAYKAATEHRGSPTVILAKTIKGYGLGEAGEGKNITHKQKELNESELRSFRSRFGIPISDKEVGEAPFYKPSDESPEMRYLKERREALGGCLPERRTTAPPMDPPPERIFEEFYRGSGERAASTTAVMVRILTKLLREKNIGTRIVPIVPDEARTFGMEPLFRQVGIYSRVGQLYDPVDSDTLLAYREARDGQILEEGITEAGAMSSFIAAGTAYATHGVNTIPFYFFYSMFGFQRIGDLIWAAGDARCRGFLVGATAGRTTLAGEGLQHQDGHSHVLAYPNPRVMSFDPAYAYELAVIVQEGIRLMYKEQDSRIFYITVGNEPYPMPPMPEGTREGILKGIYRFRSHGKEGTDRPRVYLLGSGSILPESLKACRILEEDYGLAVDVWSVTSYKQLFYDALEKDRWVRLHPLHKPRLAYVTQQLDDGADLIVAASDYSRSLPYSLAAWLSTPMVALGTDGFGRSDSRQALRDFFEVDARHIAFAALSALVRQNKASPEVIGKALRDLDLDPEKADPLTS